MKRIALILAATLSIGTAFANEPSDSIQEVVITGTRAATDVRHLSQTVNVIDRAATAADGIFAIAFCTRECQMTRAECPECAFADFAIGHLFIDAPVVGSHRGEPADGIAVVCCIAYFR